MNERNDKNMSATAKKVDTFPSGFPKDVTRSKHDLTLNKRLKYLRNKHGYSLQKVSELLGEKGIKTGKTTIQGYEALEHNINHRYPSLFMLLSLAKLYDCSIDYLFGLTDEIKRPSNDLNILFHEQEKLYWKGKEISDDTKPFIAKKINDIMNL